MSSSRTTRTVFVTGGNRGIGWEIVRQLASPPWNFHVLMGSRSLEKGESAKRKWVEQQQPQQQGGAITVIPIDLDNPESIARAPGLIRTALRGPADDEPCGWLDIIIHNAAYITYECSPQEVQQSIQTNYRGTVAVSEALAPLCNPRDGRMIFVSSAVGKTYLVPPPTATRLLASDLTDPELEQHMVALQKAVVEQGNTQALNGAMGAEAYGLGKLGGSTIYPRILARRYSGSKVFVASCCPAFGGPDTPVWLATAPRALLLEGHGGFWEQRELTNASQWDASMNTTFAQTGQYPPGHGYKSLEEHTTH